MNRIFHALLVLLCIEMGVILVCLPWSAIWDQNYFLSRFPSLIPVLLHPAVRGVISGLGVLDIWVAVGMIRRRPQEAGAPHP